MAITNLPDEQSHRHWLQSEIERLDTLLRPATEKQIGQNMAILFAALPTQDKGDDGGNLQAKAYIFALDGVPAALLTGVVKDVLAGRIADLDPRFVPTPPQLARECRDRLSGLRAEQDRRRAELHRELNPLPAVEDKRDEPMTEAEMARRAAKVIDAYRQLGFDPPRELPADRITKA